MQFHCTILQSCHKIMIYSKAIWAKQNKVWPLMGDCCFIIIFAHQNCIFTIMNFFCRRNYALKYSYKNIYKHNLIGSTRFRIKKKLLFQELPFELKELQSDITDVVAFSNWKFDWWMLTRPKMILMVRVMYFWCDEFAKIFKGST